MPIEPWVIVAIGGAIVFVLLSLVFLWRLGRALFAEPTPRAVTTTSGAAERTRIRNGLLRLEHWTDADGYWWVSVGDVLNVIDGSE